MKILKQIKTWGLATALVGSSIAFAGFWCHNCGKYHRGSFCPAQTLSCGGFNPYGCAYGYGCGPYGCSTQAWDSDDEDDYIQDIIWQRRQHHQQTVSRLCQDMRRLRTLGEIAQVQAALNQRKSTILAQMPHQPMPGFHGGFGCHPYGGGFGCEDDFGFGCQYYGGGYGCHSGFGFGCEDDFGFNCHPYGCFDDGFGYGCQYYGGGFGCDPYSGFGCDSFGCY